MDKVLICISGPSASGKTSLAQILINKYDYTSIVTTTTRRIRDGEKEGVNYFFLNNEDFQAKIKNNDFIEHVNVENKMYGVTKDGVLKSFSNSDKAVIVLEPKGAKIMEDYCKNNSIKLVKVFLNNDIPTLIERISTRYKNDTNANLQDYQKRLWNLVIEEPLNWTKKALSGEDYYDVIIDSFNYDKEFEVLKKINHCLGDNIKTKKLKV
jgi:guanylate kinase